MDLLKSFKDFSKIFDRIKYEYENNAKISDDLIKLFIDESNKIDDSVKYNVDRVYFSHDSNDSYVVTIIPHILCSNIMNSYRHDFDDTNDLTVLFVEISYDAVLKYTSDELSIWYLHEFLSNVHFDFTTNRLLTRILNLYKDTCYDIPYSISRYIIYSFYSNTFKTIIVDDSNDPISDTIRESGLDNIWNLALNKYISEASGDPKIISYENLKLEDNCVLHIANKLCRKYCTNQLKFKNNLYEIFATTESGVNGSQLMKDMIFNCGDPEPFTIRPEKYAYVYFDDKKVFLESAYDTDTTLSDIKLSDINNKVDEMNKFYKATETDNERLVIISRINNLIKLIDCMKDNKDKCNSVIKNYGVDHELDNYINTLNTIKESIEKNIEMRY